MAARMRALTEPWYFEYSYEIPSSLEQARGLLRFLIRVLELTELELHWTPDNPEYSSGIAAMPESLALRHRSDRNGWIEVERLNPGEGEWFILYAPYAFDAYAGTKNEWPRLVKVEDSQFVGFWLEREKLQAMGSDLGIAVAEFKPRQLSRWNRLRQKLGARIGPR